jgi:hypothetical protein
MNPINPMNPMNPINPINPINSINPNLSMNEILSQDTLYQDYRYLVGLYNDQYLEILRQIDGLRQESHAVRDIINSTTLDMRRRMRDLTNPSIPGATMNPTVASALVAREDEVIESLFNGLLSGVRSRTPSSGASAQPVAPHSTMVPTTRQINEAIRVVRHGDLPDRETQDRCPISWTTFDEDDHVSQIIQCGHVFNTTELSRWFRSNSRCPLCRYDIRTNSAQPASSETSITNLINNSLANVDRGATTQIFDVSGNLVDVEMVTMLNWAHGLN